MYKTLFLVFLASFFLLSCEDTPNTIPKDGCEKINCNGWETCNAGKCELNANRCNTVNDCGADLICNSDHKCSEVPKTCEGVTCSDNGDCLLSGNQPTCVCNSGYHTEGLNCIKDAEDDPCETVSCSNNGECANSGGNAICVCNPGFHSEGLECIKDINSCDGINCSNNGDCALSGDTAICVCNSGYHSEGLDCIENLDICEGVTCSNNGNCAISNDEAICVCNSGFHTEGLDCVENQDPCDGVTCSNHGSCLLSGTEAVCVCNTGYYSDGLNCEEENPCENVLCDDWQVCIEGVCELKSNQCERTSDCINDLICDSNHNCVDPINPCDNVTCSDNGTCADASGNAVCICNSGFTADGLNCVSETDPCDGISCSDTGTCVISGVTPLCICEENYHSDGLNCIADINPCENITCSENGICAVSGTEPLCVCNSGFVAEGLDCVEEIDLCNGITCSGNGSCAVSGDMAICVCTTGYHSEGLDCVEDVNNCDGVTCSENGNCALSGDTAICVCQDGYHSEGLNCVEDIDPCENITCSGNGNCLVSGDTPVCICSEGYEADGLECNQVINVGDLIISEFMADPSAVSDTQGEWIELYNASSRTLDLSSVTINKNTSSKSISGSIAPNSYFVIAKSENALVPYDFTVSFSSLANSGGTFSIKSNGVTLHEVTYPSAITGKSWQLDVDSYEFYDDFSNYCAGSDAISTDNTDLGTPKAANIICSSDLCDGINCNTGQCLSDATEYICVCDDAYTGDFCELCNTDYHFDTDGTTCIPDANMCDNQTCDDHGDCLGDTTDFICVCDNGYTDIDNDDDCQACEEGYHFDTDGTTCIADSTQNVLAGDLVITEVMANPLSVSDTSGEWIEIYNTTSNDILLENFSIIKDTTSYDLQESGRVVPANSYFVIARTSSAVLPQIDAIISMSLTNSNTHSLSIKLGEVVLDSIASYEAGSGISWQKDSNDDWCEGANVISANNSDLGTPGFANPVCGSIVCSEGATDTVYCGNNDNGVKDIECINNAWEDTTECFCSDEYTGANCDECSNGYAFDTDGITCILSTCVNGDTDTVFCGNNDNGVKDIECVNNAWEDTTECYCDDAYTGANCDECSNGYAFDTDGITCILDTCVNGDTDTVFCGNNDNGIKDVECINNAWEDTTECYCDDAYTGANCDQCAVGYVFDVDNTTCIAETCSNGDIDTVFCGNNDNGVKDVECINNAWEDTTECFCDDPYTGANCDECAAGYTFDVDNTTCILDSVTISWCNVQFPSSIDANMYETPTTVYGQVYVSGVTDTQTTANSNIVAQLGYTYQVWGVDISDEDNFYWINADFNMKTNNNHEYMADFPTDDEAESFYYIYRFSGDNGQTWTYCDLDGTFVDGDTVNAGEAVIH